MKLSLCMIVKNEESVLQRCLDSVFEEVDEIIVVDTGSTDKTVEIAKKYTEKIFYYEWINDFSAARNYAASHASSEWILVLDADEFVEIGAIKKVKEFIKNKNKNKNKVFAVEIINYTGHSGENISKSYHERIYSPQFSCYYRSIHETIKSISNSKIDVELVPLTLYHSGYLRETIKQKNKNNRNIPLLLKQVKSNDFIPLDYFFLANEYFCIEEYNLALMYYQKTYQNKEKIPQHVIVRTIMNILSCLKRLEKEKEYKSILDNSTLLYPWVSDLIIILAENLIDDGKYNESKKILFNLVKNKNEYQVVNNLNSLTWNPHYFLGVIYLEEEDRQEAFNQFTAVLKYDNKQMFAFRKCIDIISQYNSTSEVMNYIKSIYNLDSETDISFILIASKNYSMRSGYSEIINELLDRALNNNFKTVPQSLFRLKQKIISQEWEHVVKEITLLSEKDLENLLKIEIIDVIDLILLSIEIKDEKIVNAIKKYLKQPTVVNTFLLVLGNELEEGSILDREIYSLIIKRCINYEFFNTLDYLLAGVSLFDQKLMLLVGDAFYDFNYKEIACEYYSEVSTDLLTNNQKVRLSQYIDKK